MWSGLGEEFKHHLVGWDKVCTPIVSGGLRIRKLTPFNQSWWVSVCDAIYRWADTQWWRQVVTVKYWEEWGG